MEPCHLSSSLYYGGQDGYSQAPSAGPSPPPPPTVSILFFFKSIWIIPKGLSFAVNCDVYQTDQKVKVKLIVLLFFANSLMTQLKKSGAEDDPNGNNSQTASRGNWWQGNNVMDEVLEICFLIYFSV